MFKFALDNHGLYGSVEKGKIAHTNFFQDEYAMKAAAHELKGLLSFYQCGIKGLHYPLMALIDFRLDEY